MKNKNDKGKINIKSKKVVVTKKKIIIALVIILIIVITTSLSVAYAMNSINKIIDKKIESVLEQNNLS